MAGGGGVGFGAPMNQVMRQDGGMGYAGVPVGAGGAQQGGGLCGVNGMGIQDGVGGQRPMQATGYAQRIVVENGNMAGAMNGNGMQGAFGAQQQLQQPQQPQQMLPQLYFQPQVQYIPQPQYVVLHGLAATGGQVTAVHVSCIFSCFLIIWVSIGVL